MLTEISFLICSLMIIALSIFMITRKQPVAAAMTLVVIMILLAGMYGLLGAHFSAVAQLIVYTGAIMVVFVFVIMLLNLPEKYLHFGRMTIGEMFFSALGLCTAIFFGTKAGNGFIAQLAPHLNTVVNDDNASVLSTVSSQPFAQVENVKNVSALMFTNYLWPFELISFLILVAIVGAVVVAKKEKSLSNEHKPS